MPADELERLLKLNDCYSIHFMAKDADGDTLFVDIEGSTANKILEYLQNSIRSKTI